MSVVVNFLENRFTMEILLKSVSLDLIRLIYVTVFEAALLSVDTKNTCRRCENVYIVNSAGFAYTLYRVFYTVYFGTASHHYLSCLDCKDQYFLLSSLIHE